MVRHDPHQYDAMAQEIHDHLHRPALVPDDAYPSPRERECLLWSLCGLGTQQNLAKLGIQPETIKRQLSSARRRLNAANTTQAALKAVALGLLSP